MNIYQLFENKSRRCFFIGILISIFIINCCSTTSIAQDSSVEDLYAPIFHFENQEKCFPVSIEYHIQNAKLLEFTGEMPNEILQTVTISDLVNYNSSQYSSYYLDNIIGTINDDNIINDYSNQKNTLGYTVYFHRIQENADIEIIQYWLFYAFNKGDLNQHEGDWELVQIVLTNGKPSEVMYSQHHSGQKTTWEQVEKTGTHPHVYVARGSHANYFTSYSGTLGVASDRVGSNGFKLNPDQYTLIDLDMEDWILFPGMWGEINSYEDMYLGRSGPPGPMFREEGMMWNQALNWGTNLPSLNPTILIFEWIIYHFITIFVILTLVTLGFFVYRRIKQYKTEGFGPRFFSFLYIDGLNQKSIGNLLFIIGIVIAFISLLMPWYGVTASSTGSVYDTGGIIDILMIDGIQGISITLPDATGPTPLGSAVIPFSLLIGIGIVLTIIKTLGVKESQKLGRSYLYQGIKLLVPVIAIVIVIVIIASIANTMIPVESQGTPIASIFDDMASSPFGGSSLKSIDSSETMFQVSWGMQTGGIFLLLSGIILVIGGYIERKTKTTFF